MPRYIDAEQAIRLIEQDALSQVYYSKSDAIDCINALPTSNVAEVVRCKDCKFYKKDTDYCKEHNKGYCEFDNTVKSKMHFCGYGERRK